MVLFSRRFSFSVLRVCDVSYALLKCQLDLIVIFRILSVICSVYICLLYWQQSSKEIEEGIVDMICSNKLYDTDDKKTLKHESESKQMRI